MRLTRLEAKGFKSFGDKIILHFGQGVTGVVGPNGCGKSNIVDAIRWVLGETKTRNLRSDKMESIIFNGTAQRKPLQMAEVSLSFENDRGILPTEYGHVTITRRYHRSGDSEYLINNVACRLKDIDSLFADTGIGPDSYAIIELRMVDELLTDREGSRRAMFEEAAGISKFKQRRKETMRRLDDMQADLERVEDLLHEIGRNLRSLEKQAKAAEKYLELKDKHKAAGAASLQREIARRRTEAERLRGQATGLRTERDLLVKQAEAEEEGQTALKDEVAKAEQLFGSRQRTYTELQEKIRRIETERKVSSERRRAETQRRDQLSGQLNQDRTRQLSLATTVQKLVEQEQELAAAETKAKAGLTGGEQELAAEEAAFTTLVHALEQSETELRQIDERLRALQRDEEVGRAQTQAYLAEQQRLEQRSTEQSGSLAEFAQKLAAAQESLEATRTKQQRLQNEEEARQGREAALTHKAEELRDELAQASRRRDAVQNEYNLTKSLQDNLEGYPEAIRFLRKTAGWAEAQGQVPLVSDLFATPERYRVALEYFLEPVLNHYVVATEQEAMRAVDMLAKAGKGKASFFVLSRFAGLPERARPNLPTAAVPALELVECEARHQPLVDFLLSNVCMMDEPVAADDPEAIVLAADGNLVLQRRTVAGGSIGLYEGRRIGRAKNLEKLSAELATLTKRTKALEDELADTRNRLQILKGQDARPALEQLRREVARLEQDAASWRIRHEQTQQTLADQGQRLEALREQAAQLSHAATLRAPELEALRNAREQIVAGMAGRREQRQQAEAQLRSRRHSLSQTQMEAVRLSGQLAQTRREHQIRAEELDRLAQRLAAAEQELARAEQALEALSTTETVGDEDLKALYEEAKSIDAGAKEAGQALYQARQRVETSDRMLREMARRREQNQVLLSELAGQLAGLEARLEGLTERLLADFSLEHDADVPLSEPEDIAQLDDQALSKLAQQLREQLDRLGPINPVAVESYNEMRERADFINAQKADLLKAREDLEATIREIETEARRAFLETYEAVRGNFHKVFRSLFTDEDTCDLVLQNPDAPLESPIEIMARPKGKRPLSINQLSGGEKTLTAIALLFSIYLIKPAPFCIFDEVDAPLDDHNIDKFNNIIRDFSADSQFIVVTHNKRTMTHADVLYGITMVEQGVSRVIPVDLREKVAG